MNVTIFRLSKLSLPSSSFPPVLGVALVEEDEDGGGRARRPTLGAKVLEYGPFN